MIWGLRWPSSNRFEAEILPQGARNSCDVVFWMGLGLLELGSSNGQGLMNVRVCP